MSNNGVFFYYEIHENCKTVKGADYLRYYAKNLSLIRIQLHNHKKMRKRLITFESIFLRKRWLFIIFYEMQFGLFTKVFI